MKDQHVFEHSPAQDMVFPKEEKRLPRHALTQGEVEAILAQPDISRPCGLRMRAILELLYSSGLRRQEVLNLERSDIDRERRVILVRLGKGKKDRFVPLGQRALHWLDKYLAEARPKLDDNPQQQLIFVAITGNKLHANYVTSHVRKLMDRAGITKKGSCHLFRHTAASLMLDAGADVRHLQAILGHENLGTTQIYTHVSIGKLCEVHERTHPAQLFRPRKESSPQRRHYARVLSPAWQRTRQLINRLLGRSPGATEPPAAD
jgi:integrase/recombinase XerD